MFTNPGCCWLLTWTTYGTWLPGDQRGFVSPVKNEAGPRKKKNCPQTEYESDAPGLVKSAKALMKGEPVFLTKIHADTIREQFLETADYRNWRLLAAAILRNHIHLVVGVPAEVDAADLLRDFKSYASRRLNKEFGKPKGDRWWTESGSRRILKSEDAVRAAIRYVLEQEHPLLVWSSDIVDDLKSVED